MRWVILVGAVIGLMALVNLPMVAAFEPNQIFRMSLPVIEANQQPATAIPAPTATPTPDPTDTTQPGPPTGVATSKEFNPNIGVRFIWTNPADADLARYTLYQCRATGQVPFYCDFGAANQVLNTTARPGQTDSYFIVEPTDARRCFWVTFTDRSGNTSAPQPNNGLGSSNNCA